MVAKAFVDHYYNLFDTNRTALACLYHHTSMLSFKGQKSMGTKEIGRKLAQLLFEQCKHSHLHRRLPAVGFYLRLAGEEHQLKFSQMFQLIPSSQGSFFVQNDIFRLNYC